MNRIAAEHLAMSTRSIPDFFPRIQQQSARRWSQLEADPELAAPWHQLFSQVQSPRHVVSELLQNADDAGATSVKVSLHNGDFVFSHNGADFSETEFASLCRFGFSNKRNLHTIGFRGVGFKSTFSLGPVVNVVTPSLAVAFQRKRFTEPVWLENAPVNSTTTIRVAIEDASRVTQLEKNLEEWIHSGASLLFFNNISELQIHDRILRRRSLGAGPVPWSERICLTSGDDVELLLFRSAEENFPDEAVREIREERRVEDLNLPPCRVEIVLGLPGDQRLYVVLPTGVRAPLPFSCNAPFVQDPARFGIKDPAVSPTNRWLLRRIGELAAESMLAWLDHRAMGPNERAEAYELLPRRYGHADGLEEAVTEIVKGSFESTTREAPLLLNADGQLSLPGHGIALPPELYGVWSERTLLEIFAPKGHLLSSAVSTQNRQKLESWGWLTTISAQQSLNRLCDGARPPKPVDQSAMLQLWRFVEESTARFDNATRTRVQVVPVDGADVLHSAAEVVRLAGGRSRLSAGKSVADDEDRQFLSQLLVIAEQSWLDYLGTLDSEQSSHDVPARVAKSVLGLLGAMRLDAASPWDKVIQQAMKTLFYSPRKERLVSECVRLAHIAAFLNVPVPPEFQYVTKQCALHTTNDGLICDIDGSVEPLLPESWSKSHLLHDDYCRPSASCGREQWREWVSSERSRVTKFVPLSIRARKIWNERELRGLIQNCGGTMVQSFQLRTRNFELRDYDFDPQLCDHWDAAAGNDTNLWARIVRQILIGPSEFWSKTLTCEFRQLGSSNAYLMDCGQMAAAWIRRFRAKKCLPDTRGFLCAPAELLMRTPDTEPLMGIEAFIDAELDTEANRPLLRLLGVRDTATGTARLLDRLRGLAQAPEPVIYEIHKWYNALDRIAARCRPMELAELREVFRRERLILTNQSEWATTPEVFQRADAEDVPDAPTIHSSCSEFPLWGRLGVAPRPSPELVMDWLRTLESGIKLDGPNQKRARLYLQRFSIRVWQECEHWLSIDGIWFPTKHFKYVLKSGANLRVSELFPAIKEQTADLRMATGETQESFDFGGLTDLVSVIEYRSADRLGYLAAPIDKPWLRVLAEGLRRVRLPDAEQSTRVRREAARLSKTRWQPFQKLRVVPFIGGTPVGQPHSPDVLWEGETLFVQDRIVVHLIKPLVDELARPFACPAVTDAIRTCVERPDAFVSQYIQFNFEIDNESEDRLEAPKVESALRPTTAVTQQGVAPPPVAVQSPIAPQPPAIVARMKQILERHGLESGNGQPATPNNSVHELSADPNTVSGTSGSGSNEANQSEIDLPPPPEVDAGNPLAIRPQGVLPDIAERQRFDGGGNGSPGPEPQRGQRERSQGSEDRPPLIARYAIAHGFTWDASRSLYLHPQGESLRRTSGPLDWERLSSSGDVLNIFWVSEQCFARGLEVPAEVWELIRNHPQRYGMILEDGNGNAIDYVGTHLVSMTQAGALGVFPAKYRIRLTTK